MEAECHTPEHVAAGPQGVLVVPSPHQPHRHPCQHYTHRGPEQGQGPPLQRPRHTQQPRTPGLPVPARTWPQHLGPQGPSHSPRCPGCQGPARTSVLHPSHPWKACPSSSLPSPAETPQPNRTVPCPLTPWNRSQLRAQACAWGAPPAARESSSVPPPPGTSLCPAQPVPLPTARGAPPSPLQLGPATSNRHPRQQAYDYFFPLKMRSFS